jgi:hypothetical protein
MADAHAWVEVRFPGYGWLMFDPTPTKANAAVAAYDGPSALGNNPQGNLNSGDSANGGGGRVTGRFPPKNPEHGLGEGVTFLTPKNAPHPRSSTTWKPLVALAAGAVILMGLVGLPLAKLIRRRWARRRDRGTTSRVLAAYVAVLDTAADVGMGRRPAETLEEYRTRLTQTVPFSNGDFDALTALAQRAAYAGGSLEPQADRPATVLARRASKDVRKAAGPWRSLVGAYRMGSARGLD